jgi:hypothetical protein
MEKEYIQSHPIRFVETYGPRENVAEEPDTSEFDAVIVDRLKSLGYLN